MQSIQKFQKDNFLARFAPALYAFGAALAITANNPFSVLRFRLQTMPQLLRQGQILTPYQNLSDCAKRILKQQKLKGFWKGNFSVLVRFYPSQFFNFFLKGVFNKVYNNSLIFSSVPQFIINSLSGISSGFVTITMLYPLDYARVKLTNNIKGQKKRIWNYIYNTYQQEGLRGIYRGVLMSYLAMTIFRGSFFGIYDTFKVNSNSNIHKFLVSYVATNVSLILVTPLQTVIRRLMMTSGHSFKYGGYKDCIRQIYKKQGLRAFFRGVSMIPLQSVTVGLMFALFDKVFNSFHSLEDYSL